MCTDCICEPFENCILAARTHLYPERWEHLCAHEEGECREHCCHIEVLLAGLECMEQVLGTVQHILHRCCLRKQ